MCNPLIVLNEDIHRYIFQHFEVGDVQKISLVSQLWYHLIGSSRECMNKLIYSVETESQMKTLKWTLRRYEHFKVSPYFFKELSNVFRTFRVKSLRMSEIYDKEIAHGDYVCFIKSFAETVEYLGLCDVAIKNLPTQVIEFPNLKKLHCSNVNKNFELFLGNNPKLDHVLISQDNGELLRQNDVIIKFLKKNMKIKTLCLLNIENIFIHDISVILNATKLINFTFTTNFINKPRQVIENFLKFLEAQSALEEIYVIGCQNKKILFDIWNSSTHAKTFIIDCNSNEIHNSNLEIQSNNLIEEIDFCLTSSILAIFFLRASPNIKYCKVRQLSKQFLECCIQSKCLRVITFQSIDPDAMFFYKKYKSAVKARNLKLQELDFFEYLNIGKRKKKTTVCNF